MANLIMEYYSGQDLYSDGDIEDEILDFVRAGKRIENEENIAFPVLYHLTHTRENIFVWYPFCNDSKILEIGSGCGAITGLLCRCAKKVVSVELSQRRAAINYERNKQYDNLDIYVGNINDIKLDEAFDYIVLNGVFEYSGSYTKGSNPYGDFLKDLSALLCDDGRILIAIENRLGAKYFAGAPEDHVDSYFTGINEYEGIDTVKTFSRQEWVDLCRQEGLYCNKFYYPYPDYKFPTEIFTDDTINSNLYGRNYNDFGSRTLAFVNQNKLMKSLAREKVAAQFANSFLVEVTKKALQDEKKIQYVKINSDRKEQFRIYTVIYEHKGEKFVSKLPMSPASEGHIARMKRTAAEQTHLGIACLAPMQEQNALLTYAFLKTPSYDDKLCEYLAKGDVDSIIAVFEKVYKTISVDIKKTNPTEDADFVSYFGTASTGREYQCGSDLNFDIILDNLFDAEDKIQAIDYEWCLHAPIPLEYIMWRIINEAYYKHPELFDYVDRIELEKTYGIEEQDIDIFRHWENSFARKYVGSDSLSKFSHTALDIDLEKYVAEKLEQRNPSGRLYLDCGTGFNENHSVKLDAFLENDHYSVDKTLDCPVLVQGVRWDPCETSCKCKNVRAWINGESVNVHAANAISNDVDLFASRDPYYYLDFEGEFESIRILYEMQGLSYDAVENEFSRAYCHMTEKIGSYHNALVGKDEYIQAVGAQIKEKDKHIQTLDAQIDEKDEHIQALGAQISEKDIIIANNTQFINEVQKSKLWYLYRGKNWIKRKAAKIKNRFVKKEKETDINTEPPKTDNVYYSLDTCDVTNGTLTVIGWAFSPEEEIKSLGVVLKANGESVYAVIETIHDERGDVYEAFKNKNAKFSGFKGIFDVSAQGSVEIYLRVQLPEETKEYFIKQYDGSWGSGELNIVTVGSSLTYDIKKYLFNKKISYICDEEVNVIIPVYNGYEYLEKLMRGLKKTSVKALFLFIDDKSPDERVLPLLKRFESENDNVKVLVNEKNLGFVQSVNRGLKTATNHVAIVNTDVELPEQWLERLMYPIFSDKKVASSTPFSNSATLYSFPNFCENNTIYRGMEVDEIDRYFSGISPQYYEVPTGVGFCMGMSKDAIAEIGVLDEVAFSKGYGEENDWCQRAIKAGYKNVHVENLFVYHKHGGSFASEEKKKLLEENSKKLSDKHPNYLRDVAAFCSKDPAARIRNLVQMMMDMSYAGASTDLYFDHNLGGGASAYLDRQISANSANGNNTIVVRYDYASNNYLFNFYSPFGKHDYNFENLTDLEQIRKILHISVVYINELVTYPDLFNAMKFIVTFARNCNAKLVMLGHDYFMLCPSINLLTKEKNHCYNGKSFSCEECFEKYEWKDTYKCSNIAAWHEAWKSLLKKCDEVRAFSEDSKRLLEEKFGGLRNIVLTPHRVEYMLPVKKQKKTTQTFNIGLLGVLSDHKGKKIIQNVLAALEQSCADVRFVLIGYTDGEEIDSLFFSQTGKYKVEDLPYLSLQNDIDMFFIPSIWPETFSYTTEEVMQMGFPVASFDIGAPAERIKHYEKGYIFKSFDAEDIIQNIAEIKKSISVDREQTAISKYVLFVAEYISFSSRYRVEHAMEQLAFAGTESRFLHTDHLEEFTDFDNLKAVVIYRCRQNKETDKFIKKIGKHIPVYYDIDDYIFDYNQIKEFHFLRGAEYDDFEDYSNAIRACMEKCSGYIVSTEALGRITAETYPNMPVLVNRNVASAAMYVLSAKALSDKISANRKEEIVLGYFSGSKTHNSDFELISDVLARVLRAHDNVRLMLVGCLALPSVLAKLESRIIRHDFVDWKNLPELIASVDVNLMPLENTFFNQCKSENKWMEAALVKTVTIASYNEEINAVTKNGENIVLCETEDDWESKLTALVLNRQMREEIAEKAYDYVVKHKLTANSYEKIEKFLLQV